MSLIQSSRPLQPLLLSLTLALASLLMVLLRSDGARADHASVEVAHAHQPTEGPVHQKEPGSADQVQEEEGAAAALLAALPPATLTSTAPAAAAVATSATSGAHSVNSIVGIVGIIVGIVVVIVLIWLASLSGFVVVAVGRAVRCHPYKCSLLTVIVTDFL